MRKKILGFIFLIVVQVKIYQFFSIQNPIYPNCRYHTNLDKSINIVYCSTFDKLREVALSSISIINRTKSKINFYVFTSELFNKTHTIFDQIEKEFLYQAQFHFYYISLKALKKAFNYKKGDWNIYTFVRLLIIDFLPFSKCIYLDTDVFGCGDVKELWDIDLGNNLMAGVLDSLPFKKFVRPDHIDFLNRVIDSDEKEKMNHTGFTFKNYLNAGVLLMNIDELKKINFVNKSINLFPKKKFFFLDQDIINLLIGHRRLIIDYKFNLFWYGFCHECVLRHFNHKKVTHKSVKRNFQDYNLYFDTLDEYLRMRERMNATMKSMK